VQYSELCPDIGGRKSFPEGTKSYKLSVTDIPANGFQRTLQIINFVTPEHKRQVRKLQINSYEHIHKLVCSLKIKIVKRQLLDVR